MLEAATNTLVRNKPAVELFKKRFSEDKVVCYCSGVQHAKDLQELFQKEGVPSEVIDATTPIEVRKDILKRYKEGDVKVLINVGVLIEGFDEPTCNVVFNLHPTLSVVNAEQRGGRALRLDENNPDKAGYVVDFIDRNPKKPPVLFSEIIRGAAVYPDTTSGGGGSSSPTQMEDGEKIEIEGLIVDVDPVSILTITNENIDLRNKDGAPEQKEGWKSFQAIALDFKVVGIDEKTVKKILKSMGAEDEKEKQISKATRRISFFYSPRIADMCAIYISQEKERIAQSKIEEDAWMEERRRVRAATEAEMRARLLVRRNQLEQEEKLKREEFEKEVVLSALTTGTIHSSLLQKNTKVFQPSAIMKTVAGWLQMEAVSDNDSSGKYSQDVYTKIADKIKKEIEAYPLGSTVEDVQKDLIAYANGNRFALEVTYDDLKKTGELVFSKRTVFGGTVTAIEPVSVITALEKINRKALFATIRSFTNALEKRKANYNYLLEGYREEKDVLVEMPLYLSREDSLISFKKMYYELKKEQAQQFRTVGTATTNAETFIPPNMIEKIEEIVNSLILKEESLVKQRIAIT
jgi:superfamily II DNA/RNA helicase